VINVAKLREKIEKHIADAQSAHQQRLDEWDAYIQRHKTEWNEQFGDLWIKTADDIPQVIRAGEVIVLRDLPQRPGGNLAVWEMPYQDDKGRRRPDRAYTPPNELVQVLNALDLLDETEISHTALAKVGINGSVMSAVSRYLSRGYVS
jgi:hypothetical protein